jgi:hypothetical protein
VHVRLESRARAGFITGAARGLLLAAVATLPACQRIVADDVKVEWTITPARPAAGAPTAGELRVLDRGGLPVRHATLKVEAHMSHPGMAPVVASAAETGDGVYRVDLPLTMAGDWTLLLKGSLADGRLVDAQYSPLTVRPSP